MRGDYMEPYYDDDGISVYLGDCLDVMSSLGAGSATAAVFDPPYTAAGGSSNGRTSEYETQFFDHWLRAVAQALRRVVEPSGVMFSFCDWRTLSSISRALTDAGERQQSRAWAVTQALVWDRESIGMGSPFRGGYEMIAFARGPAWRSRMPRDISAVLRVRWPYGRHPHHPAEKPVELCEMLCSWSAAAAEDRAVIIDPFAGSGTTLVAARRLGYRAIGIERSERHCETIAARLAGTAVKKNKGQLSLYGGANGDTE